MGTEENVLCFLFTIGYFGLGTTTTAIYACRVHFR
jgi:hypothetical protein